MQLASLASGSKGNAWLVCEGSTLILIDCGLSYANLKTRMSLLDLTPDNISALCLTHEHSDHIAGVSTLRKKHPNLPIITSHGTAHAIKLMDYQTVTDGAYKKITDDLSIEAFTVPHDANEPLQFRVIAKKPNRRLAIVTDIGHAQSNLIDYLQDCQGLALEFNHERESLINSDYPPFLKERIGGDYGHLSNLQSLAILKKLPLENLSILMAAHLSESNNSPAIVAKHIQSMIIDANCPTLKTHICAQHEPSPWFVV